MNKIFAISLCLLFCIGCNTDNTCTIRGTVTLPGEGKGYSAVLLRGQSGVDTCRVENGSFRLTTQIDQRAQHRIKFIDSEGNDVGEENLYDMMEIVADTRRMSVDFDSQESSCSPLTAAMNDLIHGLDKLLTESDPEFDVASAMSSTLRQVYQAHSDDAVGLQAMILLSFDLDYEEMVKLLDEGGDFIRDNENVAMTLKYKLATQKTDGQVIYVRVGADGKGLSQEELSACECLDSLVGRGEYVLLNFWASWCGPCRKKIPDVISLCNKYSGKGLKVVGVTVKDKPDKTLAAMAETGINYDEIFDLDGIVCSRYQIGGVPTFILLNPQGNIVLDGYHSLDEIDNYLQKQLR